jgi:DNA-binding transcriptional regulator YiaG
MFCNRKPEEEPTEKKITEAQKLFNDAVAKKLSPDWNAIKAKHNVKTSEELTSKQIEEIRKELGL